MNIISQIDQYQQSLSFKFWNTDKSHMYTMVRSDAWGWRDLPRYYPKMHKMDLFQHWRSMNVQDDMRLDYGPQVTKQLKGN